MKADCVFLNMHFLFVRFFRQKLFLSTLNNKLSILYTLRTMIKWNICVIKQNFFLAAVNLHDINKLN